MGTIQDRLCARTLSLAAPAAARLRLTPALSTSLPADATKDVTRVLLRTGVWESFLKSFKLELQFIRRSCRQKLGAHIARRVGSPTSSSR